MNTDKNSLIDHVYGKRTCSNLFGLLDFKDPEARGYVIIGAARGFAIIVSALYTTIAVNSMATDLAGCDGTIDFGFATVRPSSVIALATTVEAFLTGLVSPVFGAATDLSSKRKTIYAVVQSAWALLSLLMLVLFIFESSTTLLLFIALTLVLNATFYELSYIVHFSYLPEISKGNDHLTAVLSSKYYILLNAFQLLAVVLFTGIDIALGSALNLDEFKLAQIALFMVFFNCAVFSFLGLRKIKNRPAANTLQAGHEEGYKPNPLTSGFKRVFKTLKEVIYVYPQVLLFLIGFMFMMATVSAVASLSTVYFQLQLGIGSGLVSMVIGVALIMSIPGAAIGNVLKRKMNIKWVTVCIALLWAVVTLVAPFLLKGRAMTAEEIEEFLAESDKEVASCKEQSLRTYSGVELIFSFIISSFIGIGIGSSYPVCAAFYSMIIPGGQEAEYFGLRTFLLKVGSILPPFVFYLVDDNTKRLDYAYLSLLTFYVIALVAFLCINLDKAVSDVSETLHLRRVDRRESAAFIGFEEGNVSLAANDIVTESHELLHEEESTKDDEEKVANEKQDSLHESDEE